MRELPHPDGWDFPPIKLRAIKSLEKNSELVKHFKELIRTLISL